MSYRSVVHGKISQQFPQEMLPGPPLKAVPSQIDPLPAMARNE